MSIRVRLHFGGSFQYVSILSYQNGMMYKDMVVPDYVNILDFNKVVVNIRYGNISGWLCKLGG